MPDPVPGSLVCCVRCRRRYILCPADNYFNATSAEDGLCEACLLRELGAGQMTVVNPDRGAEMQREFEQGFEKDWRK